ncbi:MAG: DUF2892 domain-containing protein [Sulfurimonas sp.]
MCFNEGIEDRFLRAVIGLGFLVVGVFTLNYILITIAVVLMGTGIVGLCPLYSILRINTGCKKD